MPVAEASPPLQEQATEVATMPLGNDLRQAYKSEIAAMPPPATIRLAGEEEVSNLSIMDDDLGHHDDAAIALREAAITDTPSILEQYSDASSRTAQYESWWPGLVHVLERRGLNMDEVGGLKLAAKYEFNITHKGEPTDQGFEVFAFGDQPTDPETLEVLEHVLAIVDQFSGGSIAADPKRPKIALLEGYRMTPRPGSFEPLGTASGPHIALNISAIREQAALYGVSYQEFLSIVLVHEMLGHELERDVEGRTGKYFREHFNYSEAKGPGLQFTADDAIHQTILPKDPADIGSEPVREYGRVNSAEDLATSVEAEIAHTMGWSDTADRIPRARSTRDKRRGELVLAMFNKAAATAGELEHTTGHVGSELHQIKDKTGKVVSLEAARKFEVTVKDPQTALKEEIQKVVTRFTPPEELVVKFEIPPF